MSELFENRYVRCPYHLAQLYLAQAVDRLAATGRPDRLTLTLSVPGGELTKNVIVTFRAGVDPMHFDQPWQLHWYPESGPYPEFDGEMTVRADETYEAARLELRGSYRPPGGALGAAFDWAVGGKIAAATAGALLERVASQMEARYAADEAAKTKPATP